MVKKILAGVIVLIVIGGAGFYLVGQWQIRSRIDAVIAQTLAGSTYEELDYEDLSIALNGDIRLRGIRVVEAEGIPYLIEEILISDYDLAHETPYFMTTELSGISFPEGLPGADGFDDMAVTAYIESLMIEGILPATISYRYHYDPQNNDEMVSFMNFDLPGALAGSFDGTMRGIPMEQLLPGQVDINDPEAAQARFFSYLNDLEIPQMSFSISDLGIVEEMISIGAQSNNLTPQEYREELQAQAESLYFLAPQPLQNFALEVGNQLSIFIGGGVSLSLSAEPEYGGSLQRLQAEIMGAAMNQNFGIIPDLLNLQISTQALP